MYRHILVPLDGSTLAEQVLPHVQELARCEEQTRITLLRAVQPIHTPTIEFGSVYGDILHATDDIARAEQAAREYLQKVAAVLRSEGFHVHTEMSRMPAAEAIVEFAEGHHVDLIAIATHGRSGLSRWILGSVTQKVVQATPVPVLVVRPSSS
jgi:nucleotide-binding universal stress UspA family protein